MIINDFENISADCVSFFKMADSISQISGHARSIIYQTFILEYKAMVVHQTCLHSQMQITRYSLAPVGCGHYNDVIMSAMASQITSLTIVYSTFYSGADQRKHQSSASLAFVWGIHRWPVNSPHKWPVTQKMFPLDDVIMVIVLKVYSPNTCHGS